MKLKLALLGFFIVIGTSILFAQEPVAKPKLYNPEADAKQEIVDAVAKAKTEGKHVFLQIGGNWCVWCLRFNKLVTENQGLSTILKENYVTLHVNYSKENKNEEVLASLGYPQRFGFPVFVVLNAEGERIHTQSSAYLENGEGHGVKLVSEFLQSWTPKAISPATYNK
ncbi:thioredoxin family protein [Pedobacter arcticus]|uniref:thioredoxin family protein n=1 Tax=Pedobacter arcticus TaxID=752140 RepID=UPI0002FFF200|nr:thioredoxin family protein [Pedobacter arcticus]